MSYDATANSVTLAKAAGKLPSLSLVHFPTTKGYSTCVNERADVQSGFPLPDQKTKDGASITGRCRNSEESCSFGPTNVHLAATRNKGGCGDKIIPAATTLLLQLLKQEGVLHGQNQLCCYNIFTSTDAPSPTNPPPPPKKNRDFVVVVVLCRHLQLHTNCQLPKQKRVLRGQN